MFSFFKKQKPPEPERPKERRETAPSPPVRRTVTRTVSAVNGEQASEDVSRSVNTPKSSDPSHEILSRKIKEFEQEKRIWENEKRQLVNQEEKLRLELKELAEQLQEKDQERTRLQQQMEELEREAMVKSGGMDRLKAELDAAHKESECVRKKMHSLEEDLNDFKQKNVELAEELSKKAEEIQNLGEHDNKKVSELEENVRDMERKVQELEKQLEEVKEERDRLEQERADMEAEREEEMKIVQEALEEAQAEKVAVQARFEKDFEKLRTVNTDREQQLLDDFEWKLREVEQACKRRLEERDKLTEERVREVRKELEVQMRTAQQQLNEAQQLKSYEAEVVQLKASNHDQQRLLRMANRQTEQLQVNERILKEEVSRLKTALEKEKEHYTSMQELHDKRVSDFERKLQEKLDTQRKELTAHWEDRLRRECSRMKAELDQLHEEEKKIAVDSLKIQKEQEIRLLTQNWEKKLQEGMKQISSLKDELKDNETFYNREIERSRTNADRDIFDLRRKLDKIDLQYQEQIEQLVAKHEKEIEQLNEETERRVQQMEQNYQHQMSSTRTTLELVKEQMERDAQNKMEEMEERHRNQLAQQWEQLMEEKDSAVETLADYYRSQAEQTKQELETATSSHKLRESELLETIETLQKQLDSQLSVINKLQGNVDLLEGGMQVLNEQITSQGQEMVKIQQHAGTKLRERDIHWEAELRRKEEELISKHAAQQKLWQQEIHKFHEQVQAKINTLSKLLEESRIRYENRESRPEDVLVIADLRRCLEEKESEMKKLNEEKRFYEIQFKNKVAGINGSPQWKCPKGGGNDDLNNLEDHKEVQCPSQNNKLHNLEIRSQSVNFPVIDLSPETNSRFIYQARSTSIDVAETSTNKIFNSSCNILNGEGSS